MRSWDVSARHNYILTESALVLVYLLNCLCSNAILCVFTGCMFFMLFVSPEPFLSLCDRKRFFES